MLFDGLLIAGAIGLAFAWKYQTSQTPENLPHVYLIPLSILLRWILFESFRLYDFSKQETALEQFYYLFWAGTLAAGGEWLVLLILKSYHLRERAGVSREIILNSWAMILVSTTAWRIYLRSVRRRRGEHIHRVAVVGTGPTALRVREEIRQFAQAELQLIGFISTGNASSEANPTTLGTLDEIDALLSSHRIDEVIVAPEPEERHRLLDILGRCEQAGTPVRIRLHPDLAEIYVGNVVLSELAGLPLVEIPERWRSGWYLFFKRAGDFLVALLGLILLFIPGVMVALGIKLEGLFRRPSCGPVFFVQQRVGRNRRPFRLVKFRTMIRTAEEDSGPTLAQRKDPRITRVGWLLRHTGIDELPQLWNVLKGEMSLVGPRPERPEFVERFLNEHPAYALRFRLRPGITGLAQIHGHYASSVPSKLRYDLVYLSNFSPVLDAKILFRTIQVVLMGKKLL